MVIESIRLIGVYVLSDSSCLVLPCLTFESREIREYLRYYC